MEDHHFLSRPTPSPAPLPIFGAGAAAQTQSALIAHNLVLVLAALLCTILCALGLNSTLHCVVRCTSQANNDPSDWFASRHRNSGLRQEDILALPITVCTVSVPDAGESSLAEFQMPPAECLICLSELAGGDRMRELPACGHRFHAACIDTWLLFHRSCPTCRRRVPSQVEPKSHEIV